MKDNELSEKSREYCSKLLNESIIREKEINKNKSI